MKLFSRKITDIGILGLSILLCNPSAEAACISGDCAGLGYTKSAADCSGTDYIRCPFDTSKYFCVSGSSECLDDDCPSGYSKTACTSSQKQTGTTTTAAGSTCYKCETKTCSDYNPAYYTSKQSGMTCTQVASSSVGGLTCYTCTKTAGYQKVALASPGNSIFAYSGPNFGEDCNCDGKQSLSPESSFCSWPSTNAGYPWGGTMTAERNGENIWNVTLDGVCYVKATKTDGTVEDKTFPLTGSCDGIPEDDFAFYDVNKFNTFCRDQLDNFNSGRTAGNFGIPYGSDNVVLCNSMK